MPPATTTEELFRAHAPFVGRFFGTLGVAFGEIDDLVQETFLVVHRKGGFVAGDASPRTYLAAVAVRVASSHRRRAKQWARPVEDQDGIAAGRPDLDAETAESLALVRRALERLTEEKQAVFILFELEGETCESLAAAFGVPVGTIYSRLHHARREFFAEFERLTHQRKRA